jgi:hypothetical protein
LNRTKEKIMKRTLLAAAVALGTTMGIATAPARAQHFGGHPGGGHHYPGGYRYPYRGYGYPPYAYGGYYYPRYYYPLYFYIAPPPPPIYAAPSPVAPVAPGPDY